MEYLFKGLIIAFIAAAASLYFSDVRAEDLDLKETRYGVKVIRLADGSIRRRADVLKAFQTIHPCPSTGLTKGACKGWAMNHVIPLACGGRDAVSNLDWMPNSIKSCADKHCRDRFERKIYASGMPDTANCVNVIVP